jgi:PPOX class probable F420-dependent enzyme
VIDGEEPAVRMSKDEARARFAAARVARLATVTPDGRPHVVPIVFAVAGDVLYSSVDRKPKSTTALRRLANVAANPAISVLVDHYDDDWTQLWWVRADGTARILHDAEPALDLLAARYPAYVDQRPPGPVLAVTVARWTGWSGAPEGTSS